jgi:hypothetical protein
LWVDEEEGASSMIVSAPQRPSTSITQGYLAGEEGQSGRRRMQQRTRRQRRRMSSPILGRRRRMVVKKRGE